MTGLVIVCPTIGYIDQFKTLIQTKNSRVFNLTSGLILLAANFMRFLYWIYEPFLPYLLGQSVAVFSLQLLMGIWSFNYSQLPKSHTQTRFRPQIRGLKSLLDIFNLASGFEFVSSVIVYGLIITGVYILMCLILTTHKVNSIIIIVSNVVETTVSLPMFILIVFKHDILGISIVLLVQYAFGDLLKIIMFSFSGAGWAFLFGAILQFSIDSTNIIAFFILSKLGKKTEAIDEQILLRSDVEL